MRSSCATWIISGPTSKFSGVKINIIFLNYFICRRVSTSDTVRSIENYDINLKTIMKTILYKFIKVINKCNNTNIEII